MKKYEYQIVEITSWGFPVEEVNELGKQGWRVKDIKGIQILMERETTDCVCVVSPL